MNILHNKLMVFLAALLALWTSTALAQNTLRVDHVTVETLPTTVTVAVRLDVNTALNSLGFRIAYDPQILYTTSERITVVPDLFTTEGRTSATVSVNEAAGTIIWSVLSFAGNAVITSGNGSLVTIGFDLLADLGSGTTPLTLTNVQASRYPELTSLSIGAVSGSVTGPAAPAIELDLPIRAGWNLISFPITPTRRVSEGLFDAIHVVNGSPGAANSVIRGSAWEWSLAGFFRQRDQLEDGTGYWIFGGANVTVRIAGGDARMTTVTLQPGWNLIGPADNVLNPYGSSISTTIWFWDGNRFASVSRTENVGRLMVGKGYWIYSDVEQSYAIGNP